MDERSESIPVGIVMRRQPGVTRWARWIWRAVAVLPGAGPAEWQVMRREGEAVEYHAATMTLELHRAETEAYLVALSNDPPTVYAVLREDEAAGPDDPLVVHALTASPFEAQDYLDSGEELVEAIPMPPALIGWISQFVEEHHIETAFKKRRRDRVDVERHEDGKGDARIRQTADVYRSPTGKRGGERVH